MSTSGENLQNNQTNVKPPASNSNPIIPPGAVGKNPQSTLNPKGSTIFLSNNIFMKNVVLNDLSGYV